MSHHCWLWVCVFAITACDIEEDGALLVDRDSGMQFSADGDESTVVADTGPFGPDNAWWHADSSIVPDGLAGTGYGTGDTAHDFTLVDQHGDEVQLYQFYGQVVVLELFAEWCYSCQGLTEVGQALWERHADDGFVFLSVMIEDTTGSTPAAESAAVWADRFDLTHPVLADTIGEQHRYVQVGYPTVVVIDRDMTILAPDMWPIDEDWISELLR